MSSFSPKLRIAAVADVHSPKYFPHFVDALLLLPGDIDLFLFAGDMILRGRVEEFKRVVRAVREVYGGPIVACFGNEEYDEVIPRLVEDYGDEIIWLNDASIDLTVSNFRLYIVGSRGSLDRPTRWQLKNVSNIREVYSDRVSLIERLLGGAGNYDFSILLLHYSPTYKTLVGEIRYIWPEMGCRRLEEIIVLKKPAVVVHGHAHKSQVGKVCLNSTVVFNVSLPALGGVTVFELPLRVERQTDLKSFFKMGFGGSIH